MMKPLITVEACLKCHGMQNYKLGDIRGGIAISLPLAPLLAIESKDIQAITLSHSFIWFLGVVGIGAAYGKGRSVILERVDAENTRIDITAALMASENKYRLILNSTGEGIFGVNMDGNCTFANPACVKSLGYSSDTELLGKNMHQLSHHTSVDGTPYPVEGCRIHQSLHNIVGTPRTEEIFWRADGTSFPTEYCSYPQIVNHEIVGAVVAFTDISQRKELELQKSTLHQQLLHSQKMEAIGLLAGGIAHDFNNILTIIHGFGSMIQMEVAENDKLRHEVEQILAAADRAAQLTRSLLLFSRKQITEPKSVDLNVIAQSTQAFLSRIIGEDISIRTDLWAGKLLIHADIGQIEQVLMNLATNARDAMPNGGRLDITTMTAEIDEQFLWEHGFGKVGAYALISVADSGLGMDHETCQKIFEPFFTTKEAGKGTGLGLATVYGIIKQHQGFINVESLPGQGTTFKIYLPIIEHEEHEELPPCRTYAEGGNEIILVAEDDEMTRELLTSTLSSFGYTVLQATDGDEAVQLFREHQNEIKLLLMDITMPNKSGAKAYEDILKIDPKMKAIFMTGYPVDMYKNDHLKYDGCELIKKPIFIIDLTRRIREMLDSVRA
jgi:PAS domain S-box-containing protein